ncbi:MAG: tRNA lysidine(34) synthetase TilS [Pseudomonadales bacterium]|nr:tRNA lysidine(34) synthetase TilS [Pseudomonadales bacterium]
MIDDAFFKKLTAPRDSNRWVIGLSGGLDSVALLHLCVRYRDQSRPDLELVAVHVNHQLSPLADQWQAHCKKLCLHWRVDFHAETITVDNSSRRSLEQAAREARYQVFEQFCQSKTDQELNLLLAHHNDDQIETMLYRMVRGSGARGLRGMDEFSQQGGLAIWRPLLSVSRSDLETYVKNQGIDWVEDPSNQSQAFDRNFIRHQLLPLFESRWPDARKTLSRSARLIAEASNLSDQLAALDMETCQREGRLIIAELQLLDEIRLKNVLRFWIRSKGALSPPEKVLAQVVNCVASYHGEYNAEISWPAQSHGSEVPVRWEIRSFRGCLYCHQSSATPEPAWQEQLFLGEELVLPVVSQLAGSGLQSKPSARFQSLFIREVTSQDAGDHVLRSSLLEGRVSLQVRYRQGGETFRPAGRRQKLLKKWLHDWHVPTWERDQIPLVYLGEELVCVPGYGVAEGFQASPGAAGLTIAWHR